MRGSTGNVATRRSWSVSGPGTGPTPRIRSLRLRGPRDRKGALKQLHAHPPHLATSGSRETISEAVRAARRSRACRSYFLVLVGK
jgi:hypothetical protein